MGVEKCILLGEYGRAVAVEPPLNYIEVVGASTSPTQCYVGRGIRCVNKRIEECIYELLEERVRSFYDECHTLYEFLNRRRCRDMLDKLSSLNREIIKMLSGLGDKNTAGAIQLFGSIVDCLGGDNR